LSVTATPDTINQDGASRSTVIIAAHGASGQVMSGLSVRVDMSVGGVAQDFGTLSARNLVTGPDGRVSVTYTAPPAPPPAAAGKINVVSIVASPVSNNAQGVFAAGGSSADIRLTPVGVILPPADAPTPSFVISPTPVSFNVEARFDASRSCPGAVNANGACATTSSQSIVKYAWDYGDGDTAVGQVQTHIYKSLGSFTVTLTVTNDRSISASTTQVVTVGATAGPKAAFTFSPTSPVVGDNVQFNAALSASTIGHDLTKYAWVFGDGTTGSGILATHTYATAGAYAVTLTVTDDTGQNAATQQTVTVGSGVPLASFTISPQPPVTGPATLIFNATASQAFGGATIASYSWSWGDLTPDGSGVSQTHSFNAVTTATKYTVTLTVTDSAGRTSSTQQVVQINPTGP
jgi:PKD repeat protein